ncbi:MAG: tRNA lysidine(34) synthetase TilS [Candidatus Scalindua rubra]|uniref:tRNA(Ile)-lysidine synthase n=1 Tax=Candidatus Scalindua brodae TaxID=237368 RepID=A0A0B0EP35_9BACT|nr:MAG: tRNA(Ile)-lysidine synthase [Candidatus Scalindua brodae]MBZ0109766.1 tRNA lysidine(34) synthetase TilS [Candidatus Scalindua rubra]TWU32361.1 tRNA(Ile)-lysidine synthase [Candidatus Brocadiaceae bacterium S225]
MLQLRKQVADVIREYSLFSANDRILLGVSGGPDSVALLSLIHNTNRINPPYSEIFIAHLNHSIRGRESDEDEQFVVTLAEKYGVSLITEKRGIREIAGERKISLEEAARDERYRFFESTAEKLCANVIAVGHNADDNAETILHRIIRGTGIAGVSGIRPKRKLTPISTISLVRPLLFTWRKDIIAYLKGKNLSYRVDSTNIEKDKLRNRIRMELIPHLEKNYNAKIKKSLVTLGETAVQNCDYLEAKANVLFEEVLINKEAETEVLAGVVNIVLDIYKLKKSPRILQQMIIKKAIIQLDTPLKKLSYKNYKNILNILNSRKTSVNNSVKEYLNVTIEGNELRLSKNRYCAEGNPVISETEIKIPGETELVDMNCRVKTEIRERKNDFLEKFKQNKTSDEEAVDFDKVSMPLTVRTRRLGDRFQPLGSQGLKKIKDFFIDNKVPVMERDTVPIVTMNGKPIWVVGFRIDDRVRVSEETTNLLVMKFET